MRRHQSAERPHLLVVTDVLPGLHASAGEQRLVRLCQLLVEHCDVSVVATGAADDDETPQRAERLEGLGVHVPRPASNAGVMEALVRHRYDGVLVEFWHVASATLTSIRRWQPRARIVIDTVDLEFLRDARGTEFSHGRSPATLPARKQRELATYAMADALIFTSARDEEIYRSLEPLAPRGWVVPILVRLQPRPRRSREPHLIFVGNFWHAPNVDGIGWFARDVWPRIRTAIPAATLRIVGSNSWEKIDTLAAIDGVAVVGFVEDLAAAYDDAAVAVAPLRWGAGMKGKVCEALAHGVPLVTTGIGVEGLLVEPGTDVVVAEGGPDTARAVVALLEDEAMAERIGSTGQAAIARQCLPEVLRPVIAEMVDFVTGGRDRPAPRSWWLRAAAGESICAARRHATRLRARLANGRSRSHQSG